LAGLDVHLSSVYEHIDTLLPMHIDALTEAEQRVLGCLIEKRLTTPDQYPLTLNALRLACNQLTNRDPVVSYDEQTVREAAQRLSTYGLARLASGHSSRAVKYRHLASEALAVSEEELVLLAVLLLRGEQTSGELKARAERMVAFQSLEAVEAALTGLSERGYAERIERRPGQKEDRFRHSLGEPSSGTPVPAPSAAPASAPAPPIPSTPTNRSDVDVRLEVLERQVTQILAELRSLGLGREGETD
jgi:uncharacterized protein YceH (UPF0502 family)